MRPLQLGLAVAAGILFSALFSFAWTGPTSSPPNGNVDAPINVGATTQFKNGNIGLYGNILLAANGGSYLNFGSTSGSSGYGIRDNNGTLEFKNTGGSWTNLTNTVTNVLGIGAVSQIKFADGSVQTTAPVASCSFKKTSFTSVYGTQVPTVTGGACPGATGTSTIIEITRIPDSYPYFVETGYWSYNCVQIICS